MGSNLIVGHKAFSATLGEIAKVPTPEATETWKPVGHIEFISAVKRIAEEFNLTVSREEYGLSASGDKLFGVLDFALVGETEIEGYVGTIGIRNSHDKSVACGLCAGTRVTVCENLVLSGEYSVVRKHTPGMNLEGIIRTAFTYLPAQIKDLIERIENLKLVPLTDDEARLLIFRACESGAISSSTIIQVWDEYCDPTFPEFAPGNRHGLLMAITEVAKKHGSATVVERMYRHLGSVFEM